MGLYIDWHNKTLWHIRKIFFTHHHITRWKCVFLLMNDSNLNLFASKIKYAPLGSPILLLFQPKTKWPIASYLVHYCIIHTHTHTWMPFILAKRKEKKFREEESSRREEEENWENKVQKKEITRRRRRRISWFIESWV